MTARHLAEEFRRFLNLIDRNVAEHLSVHVVLDNSATHKTSTFQRWLLRHPRFHLHFTPTYSSWLNLVERWSAELTTKSIKRGAHRSVFHLVASIRTWIEGSALRPTASGSTTQVTRFTEALKKPGVSLVGPTLQGYNAVRIQWDELFGGWLSGSQGRVLLYWSRSGYSSGFRVADCLPFCLAGRIVLSRVVVLSPVEGDGRRPTARAL